MADHQDAGPEYKVFVGGISWQMDDTALMKGAGSDLSVWQRGMDMQTCRCHVTPAMGLLLCAEL